MSDNSWIDVSVPIEDGMIKWPNDPDVTVSAVRTIASGDSVNLSEMRLGSHTGTHLDAPYHFYDKGKRLSEYPLDTFIGTAKVFDVGDAESISSARLDLDRMDPGDRVLFKTANSSKIWYENDFDPDFVYLTAEAAALIAEREVVLVGIDHLSIGGFKRDGKAVHETLLGKGICILEGLDLKSVEAGVYDMICLPVNLRSGDGAPCRVVLRGRL